MNNNTIPNLDDGIGTDPTMVEVVDVLDVEDTPSPKAPKEEKKKEPKKGKAKDTIKLILFTFMVLALMGGIAFGLYYYLSIANSKKTSNTPSSFSLNNKTIYVGQELSTSISEYGDFSKLDITTCSEPDFSEVDTSTPGEYSYSIMCDNNKYSAKIIVEENNEITLKTNIIYKKVNDKITPDEFITSTKEYKYEFASDSYKEYLTKVGGPYIIEINVSDENKNDKVYGILYVTDKEIAKTLECQSKDLSSNDLTYQENVIFKFTAANRAINVNSKLLKFKFEREKYYELLSKIEKDKLTIDSFEGTPLRDDQNFTISLFNNLIAEELDKEYGDKFPVSLSNIKKYYSENKEYTCESK